MRIMTVGNCCTLPGLPSNDYISCMQHDSNLTGSLLCFSYNIIINEVNNESLPPSCTYLCSHRQPFTNNQDQLGFTITNNRTGLGYLQTWQKCDTNKLNNAIDDIATCGVIPVGLVDLYTVSGP
jgi:hypothetical protein